MNINFELKEEYNKNCISCIASTINEAEICECKVGYDISGSGWVISSWFTKEGYQNKGIGKETLQKVLACLYARFGEPDTIGYIWNGTNEYVLKWMERHFDAKCLCPLAIQKTQSGDDWLSHMYDLDVRKVLNYFDIFLHKTNSEDKSSDCFGNEYFSKTRSQGFDVSENILYEKEIHAEIQGSLQNF